MPVPAPNAQTAEKQPQREFQRNRRPRRSFTNNRRRTVNGR
jgi:hypothetical protein